jgi:hypothetical protein
MDKKFVPMYIFLALFSVSTRSESQQATPLFGQSFLADGDAGQCNGAFMGTDFVNFGEFTKEIRIDTDDRPGGCLQSFAIVDTNNVLAGLKLGVNFFPDGQGQCDNPGPRTIPINKQVAGAQFSPAYRIDTGSRPGGCQLVFSVEGRNDVALDVIYIPDDDFSQCKNAGVFTAVAGRPVQIGLDTDNRSGGCRLKLRLRNR